MSDYGSHVTPIAFEVPNWLNATSIHPTWPTKCPLQMATADQERQSNSLRVLIYCLLEFLINIICSFHVIVIVIVELNLISCGQCKILTSRGSKNEAEKAYTKAKKSILVSGNWPGKHSFSLTRPHIYNIYKIILWLPGWRFFLSLAFPETRVYFFWFNLLRWYHAYLASYHKRSF